MTIALAFASPFTPVGYTSGGTPVYPAQGGRSGGGIEFAVGDDDGADPEFDSDRDEDDDEDDDRDDDEPAARRTRRGRDDDGDDEGGDDWTPPDRDSWERMQGALKRANREAGQRRRVGKAMERLGIDDLDTWLTERGIDPSTGQPYGSDVVGTGDDDEWNGHDGYEREDDRRRDDRDSRQRDRDTARQMRAAEQRGRRAEREALMPLLAEQAARGALRDAGFSGTRSQLDRMLQSIRPGDLELDMDADEFELIGLDEEIERLKEDFPERFERSNGRATRRTTANGRATRGARDVDGGDRGRQQRKPLTWLEKASDQMMQRGR